MNMFAHQLETIRETTTIGLTGRVSSVSGLRIVANDFPASLGSMCRLIRRVGQSIEAQVVGFSEGQTILLPLDHPIGVGKGDRVDLMIGRHQVAVGDDMLGRVLDGRGEVIDGKGKFHIEAWRPLHAEPPKALDRPRIKEPLSLGIRSIDSMLTIGRGQRMGIFAGTGVGKSVLLGMAARYTEADVTVVSLVGERGREVMDFLEKDLGPEGRAKSVTVVSTSDESPVLRVRACFVATAIAEYFRDQGKKVLLLMDSLTRVAMAQREIGLAAGEPPTTKGYPPSAFALLPQLLERSGTSNRGDITGIYSVLVEGDDLSDPIADAVRGVLDGHIWLSRSLASRAHYPAIDIMESISRIMVDVVDEPHLIAARRIKRLLAVWQDIEDLVNIGAYARGTNPEYDLAIEAKPRIDAFLQQTIEDRAEWDQTQSDLAALDQEITVMERKVSHRSEKQAAGVG